VGGKVAVQGVQGVFTMTEILMGVVVVWGDLSIDGWQEQHEVEAD